MNNLMTRTLKFKRKSFLSRLCLFNIKTQGFDR